MSQYTEYLNEQVSFLSPDDEDYEERLREVALHFRGFDEALTAFLVEKGYDREPSDIKAKAHFLTEKYRAAGIKEPHSFREWFSPEKHLDRETVFPLCFAFDLGVEGTNDFFRRVQFERSFDCHTINEAVYYFCMRNGYTYNEARDIIAQVPETKKLRTLPKQDVKYTGSIINEINNISDKNRFIRYLTDNIADFEYNQASAISDIQRLWSDIRGDKEGKNSLASQEMKLHTDNVKEKLSTWRIFAQIMGLDDHLEKEFSASRSLSSVLTNSALLPFRASHCFPSRLAIDTIRAGKIGDSEAPRKLLVLLVFYKFWTQRLIEKKNRDARERYDDPARCLADINKHLTDAGYPELYEGNPYDWIFMWALNDEEPLNAFRSYIGEVFVDYEENASAKPNE